jgi:hypothetical protein
MGAYSKRIKGDVPSHNCISSSFLTSIKTYDTNTTSRNNSITANMVNFVASIALLLTAVSSVVAVPHTIEARKVSCMDNLPADSLANVRIELHPQLSQSHN